MITYLSVDPVEKNIMVCTSKSLIGKVYNLYGRPVKEFNPPIYLPERIQQYGCNHFGICSMDSLHIFIQPDALTLEIFKRNLLRLKTIRFKQKIDIISVARSRFGNTIILSRHSLLILDEKYNEIKEIPIRFYENLQNMCLNSRDQIIVCDHVRNWILLFDSNGDFLSRFASVGKGPNQSYYPGGLCVDGQDNILVGDVQNDRICVFNSDFSLVQHLSCKGVRPRDIYIIDHNIIISDHRHSIIIFSN